MFYGGAHGAVGRLHEVQAHKSHGPPPVLQLESLDALSYLGLILTSILSRLPTPLVNS